MAPATNMASAANAVEANLFAFFQHAARWPRLELHEDRDCLWTISDLPFPLFNSVLRAGCDRDDADRLIAARLADCRARDVPMLWWTGPSTRPSDLADRLAANNFFNEPAFGMIATIADAPEQLLPPGVAVDEVTSAAMLEQWCGVLCSAFGAPEPFGHAFAEFATALGLGPGSSFRHFLSTLNGEPVGTSSLFLGAGVAGIYDVSTLPERRRRGIGAAVTLAAIEAGRAQGHRTAILHSSPLGAGMYRSIGFTDVCPIGQHVWAAGLIDE